MEHHTEHEHHHHNHDHHAHTKDENLFKLAMSTTLHCLLGCGLGEILGMIIATAIGLNNFNSIALAVSLGFVFGFILGMRPLLKGNFSFARALKTVLIAEGLSIVVMETAEVLVEVYTPGVMAAGLTDAIFWLGMLAALAAGFLAAFPVNFILVKNGIRHQH